MAGAGVIEPEVVYEDNHLLAVIKPAGILTQADASGEPDMLTICRNYIKKKYNKPGQVYLGIVHRLDRSVSGPLLFARTSKAAGRLAEQFRNQKTRKFYQAIVVGQPPADSGECATYLKKDRERRVAVGCAEQSAGARLARLKYRKLATKSGASGELIAPFGELNRKTRKPGGEQELLSLLEIELLTGRFHQIRFQLSQLGTPILGDIKYGSDYSFRDHFLALEAILLEVFHPISGEIIRFSGKKLLQKKFERVRLPSKSSD